MGSSRHILVCMPARESLEEIMSELERRLTPFAQGEEAPVSEIWRVGGMIHPRDFAPNAKPRFLQGMDFEAMLGCWERCDEWDTFPHTVPLPTNFLERLPESIARYIEVSASGFATIDHLDVLLDVENFAALAMFTLSLGGVWPNYFRPHALIDFDGVWWSDPNEILFNPDLRKHYESPLYGIPPCLPSNHAWNTEYRQPLEDLRRQFWKEIDSLYEALDKVQQNILDSSDSCESQVHLPELDESEWWEYLWEALADDLLFYEREPDISIPNFVLQQIHRMMETIARDSNAGDHAQLIATLEEALLESGYYPAAQTALNWSAKYDRGRAEFRVPFTERLEQIHREHPQDIAVLIKY